MSDQLIDSISNLVKGSLLPCLWLLKIFFSSNYDTLRYEVVNAHSMT